MRSRLGCSWLARVKTSIFAGHTCTWPRSLGVVVAAGAMLVTGWLWLDPMVSLFIAGLIMWGTWGLLRDSTNLALHAVPAGIDPEQVREHLGKLSGVSGVHDLHIWAMSTNETALTCHLVMPEGCPGDAFLADAAEQLQLRFGITHSTLQVERGQNACALAPETVV